MQTVSEFQINEPPPLGSPDCQFPELTLPGRCINVIMYIPRSPDNEVRSGAPPAAPQATLRRHHAIRQQCSL